MVIRCAGRLDRRYSVGKVGYLRKQAVNVSAPSQLRLLSKAPRWLLLLIVCLMEEDTASLDLQRYEHHTGLYYVWCDDNNIDDDVHYNDRSEHTFTHVRWYLVGR